MPPALGVMADPRTFWQAGNCPQVTVHRRSPCVGNAIVPPAMIDTALRPAALSAFEIERSSRSGSSFVTFCFRGTCWYTNRVSAKPHCQIISHAISPTKAFFSTTNWRALFGRPRPGQRFKRTWCRSASPIDRRSSRGRSPGDRRAGQVAEHLCPRRHQIVLPPLARPRLAGQRVITRSIAAANSRPADRPWRLQPVLGP